MRKSLARFMYFLVGCEVVAGLVLGFLAYFVISVRKLDGSIFDGLGRPLEPTPVFVRFFFQSDRMWPGVGWFVLDLVVFWMAIAIGYGLIKLASKLDEARD